MSRQDISAAVSIICIYTLGIFLFWYSLSALKIPLPADTIIRTNIKAIWSVIAIVVLPCAWAIWRLGLTLADFGFSTRNAGRALLLGCLLYSLALAAFIHCSADPFIANHLIGKVSNRDAIRLLFSMSLTAAGTDLATRGFVLFGLARFTHVSVAIVAQNLAWYLGHIQEIGLLKGCLGYAGALGLTLTLGILGDFVALKTRNVLGLAVAHIFLNITVSLYIRQL